MCGTTPGVKGGERRWCRGVHGGISLGVPAETAGGVVTFVSW